MTARCLPACRPVAWLLVQHARWQLQQGPLGTQEGSNTQRTTHNSYMVHAADTDHPAPECTAAPRSTLPAPTSEEHDMQQRLQPRVGRGLGQEHRPGLRHVRGHAPRLPATCLLLPLPRYAPVHLFQAGCAAGQHLRHCSHGAQAGAGPPVVQHQGGVEQLRQPLWLQLPGRGLRHWVCCWRGQGHLGGTGRGGVSAMWWWWHTA